MTHEILTDVDIVGTIKVSTLPVAISATATVTYNTNTGQFEQYPLPNASAGAGWTSMVFIRDGDGNDKWLTRSSSKIDDSNIVPGIIPFNAVLKYLTFSNVSIVGSSIIQVYKNATLVSSVPVNMQKKLAHVFSPTIQVASGDEISVYINWANGLKAKDTVVEVYFG